MAAFLNKQGPAFKYECDSSTLIQILFSFFAVGMIGIVLVLWKVPSLALKALQPAWSERFSRRPDDKAQ